MSISIVHAPLTHLAMIKYLVKLCRDIWSIYIMLKIVAK